MAVIDFKAEELPSRGISYPEGTVFTVKLFTYGEVQDLNTGDLSIETKVNTFLKATTNNTGLRGEDMTYIDYIYIHLARVASVYGNDTLKLPLTCPYCGGSNTEVIKFTDLKMNDISEYGDIFPLTFDIGGEEFSFSFLTLEKMIKWFRLISNIQHYDLFIELEKEHTEMQKEVDKITPENPNPVLLNKWERLHKQFLELSGKMTNKNKARAVKYKPYGFNALLLAFMCSAFGTEKFDNFLEKVTKTELSAEVMEFLDFTETTLGRGLEAQKATCPHCSKVYSYSMEDNVNDVYPFRKSATDIANRLRALQASKADAVSTEERGVQQDNNPISEPPKRQRLNVQQ